MPADPALLQVDLGAWAGDHTAAAGRKEALLGRVEMLRLAADGRAITARVRGNRRRAATPFFSMNVSLRL
mgnify:CR=1 FL=1